MNMAFSLQGLLFFSAEFSSNSDQRCSVAPWNTLCYAWSW